MMTPVLRVQDLKHVYKSGGRCVDVFQGLQLEVASGQMVAVQGPSGCGKTTLLLASGGMLTPTAGRVSIGGADFYCQSLVRQNQLRQDALGYMFQTLELIPYLTVRQNIDIVKGAIQDETTRWLSQLGLSERASHKPSDLSHGQRQRVALARALVHKPQLLIADEPTGNLDSDNSQRVFEVLRDFANQGGAVLIATHDRSLAKIADRRYSLVDGRLCEMAEPNGT